MDELKLFIPITKVDVAKRLVYGTIAEEIADKAGEIMDYATAKPEFEAWSGEIAKASDGKSVGNLRAMHGNIAAGKLTTIAFDDDAKRIEACGKVVDDAEWNKVLEGVYTGFSMGGKYLKRWKDADQPELTRYTPKPAEVSLVDNPCIPTATFEVVKEDGSTEMRKFKPGEPAPQPTNVAPDVTQGWQAKDGSFHLTKAAALAHNAAGAPPAAPEKAVLDKLDALLAKKGDGKKPYGDVEYADPGYQDDKKKRYPLDTEEHIRAAWNYIHKKKNAAKYSAEDVKKIKAKIVSAWKDKIDKDGPPSASDKAAMAVNLAKSLYDVARIASIIQDLAWIRECLAGEAIYEGDNSPAPEHLREIIQTLASFLTALATEEGNEAAAEPEDEEYEGDEYEILEMAAIALGLEKAAAIGALLKDKPLGKALAKASDGRHSARDQKRVQRAHDMAKSMHDNACALGAECKCDGMGKEEGEGDGAEKLAKLTAERDALEKRLEAFTAGVEARIAALEAQPMPGGPVLTSRVITKGQDATGGNGGDVDGDGAVKAFRKHLETLSPAERALALMKFSLATPLAAKPDPRGPRI